MVEALGSISDDLAAFEKGFLKSFTALLVLLSCLMVSQWQKLGLELDMLVSLGRGFVQLTVVGFVLNFIFNQTGLSGIAWMFGAFCMMVTVAGYTAGGRAKGVPHGALIAGISIFIGSSITMTLIVLLRVFPSTPQYIIPMTGMMVGTTMTATGVVLKRLRESIRQQLHLVESGLALGATPRQSISRQIQSSLSIALAPILDNAKTVGIISLPGTMTGLIMGGASPFEATQMQIVVMFVSLGANTFSTLIGVFLAWPFFFTSTGQIKMELFAVE